MNYRCIVLASAVAATVALASAPMAGQAPRSTDRTAAQTTWTQPRTAWGDPDMQGVWRSRMSVPFERSDQYKDREFLTDEEVAERTKRRDERNALRLAGKQENVGFRAQPNYNSVFYYTDDLPQISKRTSAIIDPPNGKIPAWTLEQVKRWEEREAASRGRGEADTWEDQPPSVRCIPVVGIAFVGYWGLNQGPAARLSSFAEQEKLGQSDAVNNVGNSTGGGGGSGGDRRILQSPGFVVISDEEGQEYRIIPVDGRPALGPKHRQWLGSARGRWEGNTLVVEVTNIKYDYPIVTTYGTSRYPGSGETLRITERYTRVGPDAMEYSYTINDPAVYVRPYTALYELSLDNGYKMAPGMCHEQLTSSMGNMLATARADEETALKNAQEAARARQLRFEERKKEAMEYAKKK